MNARLSSLLCSQAIADRRANADKRKLLDPRNPDRPRLIPLWVYPVLTLLLAGFVFDLWRLYAFVAVILGGAWLILCAIEGGDASKKERQ